MHTFIIEQLDDKATIMFCRKCGLTFDLNDESYRLRWKHVPFTDAVGDEFELSPMPTCAEGPETFEEFGKPE